MPIADNLTLLNSTKADIKAAIAAKGVDMTGVAFTDYDTKISQISSSSYTRTWTRPSDWLTMPTMTVGGQQMIAILMAIRDKQANNMSFQIQGAFTVDWGDGVVENFASNSTASHDYSFSNAVFNGTTTTEGFKQALIKITPQAGNNLTYANFDVNPTNGRSGTAASRNNIEMAFNTPNISDSNLIMGGTNNNQHNLRIITLFDIGSIRFMTFQDYWSLEMIFIENNKNCFLTKTNYSNMFNNCYSLIEAPFFNMNITTPQSIGFMFQNCNNLQYCPLYDTSVITNMDSMFINCQKIKTVPLFNTVNVTNMNSMFNGCSALETIPEFNFTNVTTNISMFQNTTALKSIPSTLVLGKGTVTTSSYINVRDVKKLKFQVTAGTTMQLFLNTSRCSEVEITNHNGITNFNTAFGNMTNLTKISGGLNMSAATTVQSAFTNCFNLKEIIGATAPTSGTVTTTSMFANCFNLQRIDMPGMANTFSVQNCNMGAEALNELYTGLATVTGKTITVTGNPGTATDNPAIATAKGWTVVG